MSEAYNVHMNIYQDFSSISELREGAKFESGTELRQRLEALDNQARAVTLSLLTIIQHRPDLRPDQVPGPLHAASLRFRTMLARLFENLSDHVQGKPERPWPNLEAELSEMERTFAIETKKIADPNLLAHLRAHLALYREIVPVIGKLRPLSN